MPPIESGGSHYGGLIEDSPQSQKSDVNPKSEYRNPKQIRITKIRMTETTDISI